MKQLKANLILVFSLCLAACSFGKAGSIDDVRANVVTLQQNPRVLKYAPTELKQAEDALIAAVKAWNAGQKSKSDDLLVVAREKIKLTEEVVKREAALGLDDEAWEQRRWLREVRAKRMSRKENLN